MTLKRILLGTLALNVFNSFAHSPADTSKYVVQIDIKNIQNDRAQVKVFPPKLSGETAIYNMPKIVPGTYSVSNFGRFIDDFTAFDEKGDTLESLKLDENRWEISDAHRIHQLTYWVNDTYDAPGSGNIFEPAGTNIEAGKNVVLNAYGFSGYFDDTKSNPIEVQVIKPTHFYGETSLRKMSTTDNQDVYWANNYFEYHDCPMLYAKADTASMYVSDTRIAVAVYSPNGMVTSQEVMESVKDIFPAAARYLGGSLPVNQYSILVYLNDGSSGSGAYGALEHNSSTVFALPEAPIEALRENFKSITAHEFFHIVTPLNIHSEEIDDYDFMNPKMSAHLWLYEGCTEYAAQHVQVKEGDMSFEQFLIVMRRKIINASSYDSGVAFTEMSKKALAQYADQYLNVYEQGALIGMVLDLKLLDLSDGEYGIQNLMQDLSHEYGIDKPFKDDALFSEMARLSGYPEIELFLQSHVGGTEPLPFAELLENVGVFYAESVTKEVITGGGMSLGLDVENEQLVVMKIDTSDDFGKEMGFEVNDRLVEWNGVPMTVENVMEEFDNFRKNTKVGDTVKVEVTRENANGKWKKKKLKASAQSTIRTSYSVLEEMDSLTTRQKMMRLAWVKK